MCAVCLDSLFGTVTMTSGRIVRTMGIKPKTLPRRCDGFALEALEPRLLLSASPVSASADEQLAGLTLSQDISHVPLLDGETTSGGNNLMNRFGGVTNLSFNATVSHTTDPGLVHSGDGAMRLDVGVSQGQFGFVITALGGVEPSSAYTDTRDLTWFDEVRFFVRNQTGSSFTLRFEVKDYRDSNSHRASQNYVISAADQWTEVVVPLDLAAPGWVISGTPDLSRARQFAMLVEANQGSAVNGAVIIDDMVLVEPGGAIDPATAPIDDVVERLAERQFRSLWGATDPVTGALETNAQNGRVMAMNTTSSLIKLLPGAIERGWVTQFEADVLVSKMIATMNTGMDNQAAMGGGYLPARYMDRVTFTPSNPEESVIDGAFMFLALYGYKSQAGINAGLKTGIETLLDRFDFASFQLPGGGWSFAYNHNTNAFITSGYDGYGGEVWSISLAAHLAQVNHVDITTNFHSGTVRSASFLVDSANTQFNHSQTQFRPPFVQWLFDLYVDTNDRGVDNYPNGFLATNPFDNAVKYQKDVHDYFEQNGRGLFLQPDAGSSGSQYQQFSAYNDHGEPDVFMPWSVAFSFLGEPGFAEAALRNSLQHNLHGPFGLSDSAIWATGAAEPSSHPANNDLWNTSLATMAYMDYLYDDSHFLNDLPEVKAALDLVFPNTLIEGDLNKDGFVGIDDLNMVLSHWNESVAPGDWFAGDPSGDGFVGIDDLNAVLGNWNASAPPAAEVTSETSAVSASVSVADTAESQVSEPVVVTEQAKAQRTVKQRRMSSRVTRSVPLIETSASATQRSGVAAWQQAEQASAASMNRFGSLGGAADTGAGGVYTPPLSLWEPGDETQF